MYYENIESCINSTLYIINRKNQSFLKGRFYRRRMGLIVMKKVLKPCRTLV